MWCKEAYLRAFNLSLDSTVSNGRAWLLTIVRNTSYTLLKKNRAVDLTAPFDEEIHAPGYESVSPATILEHSEDAELIKEAMDELSAEFREILTLRHQEGLSYKEIGRHRANSARYGHVAARPRARQAQGMFGGSDGKGEIDELRRSYKTDDGYLDGELDPITSQTIEQHLRGVS